MRKIVFIALLIFSSVPLLYAANQQKEQTTVRKIDVKVDQEGRPVAPAQDTMSASSPADAQAEVEALRKKIQSFFEEGLPQTLKRSPQDYLFPGRAFEPPANMEDHGDKLTITLDLPGMRKEDIQVLLKNGLLTVSGERKMQSEERKDEKGKKIYSQERFSGSFQRTFKLPVPVLEETMKAKYENGILTVEAAKAVPPPPAESKSIPVE